LTAVRRRGCAWNTSRGQAIQQRLMIAQNWLTVSRVCCPRTMSCGDRLIPTSTSYAIVLVFAWIGIMRHEWFSSPSSTFKRPLDSPAGGAGSSSTTTSPGTGVTVESVVPSPKLKFCVCDAFQFVGIQEGTLDGTKVRWCLLPVHPCE